MAEKTERESAPKAPQETPAQQASRAFAESQAEAAALNLTETKPGGEYVVGDRRVDANGKDLGPAKGD